MSKFKFFIMLGILLCFNSLFAQSEVPQFTQDPKAHYRLFPTSNNWTFLKLNTVTGVIHQVQFSVNEDNERFSEILSYRTNVIGDKKKIPGRYTLYATFNNYNFILLDQIDGDIYQVQWSQEYEYRAIWDIDETY